jgi:predicted KAP-like P-loop ATPase
LVARFDSADRLAPLMTTASQIAGNPRLIKRFLNALSIRMTIAKTHGVGIDEAPLAKMLLFERCGEPAAFDALAKAVTENEEGKPRFLTEWEEKAQAGQNLKLDPPWDSPFVREWLTVPPKLGDLDLRGILYVSREHAPLITSEDRLSSEAADILARISHTERSLRGQGAVRQRFWRVHTETHTNSMLRGSHQKACASGIKSTMLKWCEKCGLVAILQNPDMAASMRERLGRLSRPEITVIMDRVLERARREQSWGTPPILEALSPRRTRRRASASRRFFANGPRRKLHQASFPSLPTSYGRPNCLRRGGIPM